MGNIKLAAPMVRQQNAILCSCTQLRIFLFKGKTFRIKSMCDRIYSKRFVDVAEVISSIPIVPTKKYYFLQIFKPNFRCLQKTLINIYPMSLVIIAKG